MSVTDGVIEPTEGDTQYGILAVLGVTLCRLDYTVCDADRARMVYMPHRLDQSWTLVGLGWVEIRLVRFLDANWWRDRLHFYCHAADHFQSTL